MFQEYQELSHFLCIGKNIQVLVFGNWHPLKHPTKHRLFDDIYNVLHISSESIQIFTHIYYFQNNSEEF